MSKLAEAWTKYKKKDFKRLTWDEYFATIKTLERKVAGYLRKNKFTIDAVVPILRGGAFFWDLFGLPAWLLKIIPVQYKYFYIGKKAELKEILPFNADNLPKNPTILLVEGNHCYGLTAETAAKDIKEKIPGAKIVYAADNMDYNYQKNKYADAVFYGILTNECRELTPEQAKKKGVYPYSYIAPWEVMKEEWETVNAKQFKYSDIDDGGRSYATKASIDLS